MRYSGNMIEPQTTPVTGVPLPWTPGTNGRVTAEAVLAPLPLTSDADLEQAMGEVQGHAEGQDRARGAPRRRSPCRRRHRAAATRKRNWLRLALAPEPPPSTGLGSQRRARGHAVPQQFLKDEGALLVLTPGGRGEWGVIVAAVGGSRDLKDPVPPPTVAVFAEQYDRIARLLDRKIPVRLEFNIEAKLLRRQHR